MPMTAPKVAHKTMGGPMADDPPQMGPEIDLRIEDQDWVAERSEPELLTIIETALGAAASHARAGRVDLLLTSDAEMQVLNRTWRDRDKPTDVLSFPSDDDAFETGFLGDIALGYGVMTADATSMSKSFNAHFSHLLIHGYLHLLGFDHQEPGEAEEMETLETKILAELGYSDPYSMSETQ